MAESTRRRFLHATGIVGVTAVTGCLRMNSGGDGTSTSTPVPTATATVTETSTDTPEATPTETPEVTTTDTPDPTTTETSEPKPTPSADRTALSFESGTIDSTTLPRPWYVMLDSGTASISSNSSAGFHAIRLRADGQLAVGIDVDVTDVSQVLADMYPVDVDPYAGYVKIALDEPDLSNGHLHTRDHPGRTEHGGNHTEAFRDGEWHEDIQFYKSTGDGRLLSDITGIHTVILHASGDYEVLWDNVRFQNESEDILQLGDVLA